VAGTPEPPRRSSSSWGDPLLRQTCGAGAWRAVAAQLSVSTTGRGGTSFFRQGEDGRGRCISSCAARRVLAAPTRPAGRPGHGPAFVGELALLIGRARAPPAGGDRTRGCGPPPGPTRHPVERESGDPPPRRSACPGSWAALVPPNRQLVARPPPASPPVRARAWPTWRRRCRPGAGAAQVGILELPGARPSGRCRTGSSGLCGRARSEGLTAMAGKDVEGIALPPSSRPGGGERA